MGSSTLRPRIWRWSTKIVMVDCENLIRSPTLVHFCSRRMPFQRACFRIQPIIVSNWYFIELIYYWILRCLILWNTLFLLNITLIIIYLLSNWSSYLEKNCNVIPSRAIDLEMFERMALPVDLVLIQDASLISYFLSNARVGLHWNSKNGSIRHNNPKSHIMKFQRERSENLWLIIYMQCLKGLFSPFIFRGSQSQLLLFWKRVFLQTFVYIIFIIWYQSCQSIFNGGPIDLVGSSE